MRIYKPDDYKGCFNLLKAEKDLIKEAQFRYKSPYVQAKALGISYDILRYKRHQHGLQHIYES